MKVKAYRSSPSRADIERLQALASAMPQFDLSKYTKHLHADGMYCRILFREAGTTIIGKCHRREHFYMVLTGEVTVSGDGHRERIKAPHIMVSAPGTKRAVHAHVDSICLTVHRKGIDSMDLDEIERELIEPDDTALFDARNKLKFDVPAFRELTARVISDEKPGFWSDWTEEQQRFYTAGDWRAFSLSRGYSKEAIEHYAEWRNLILRAQAQGLNPYAFINDLATAAALSNIATDAHGEILRSSHAPFSSREEPPCLG